MIPTTFRSEWDRDTALLSVIVGTGFLLGEHAASLLLVGPPSEGKSTLLQRFRHVPTVQLMGDVTVYPLLRLSEDDPQGLKRHLVLTEFQRIFSRRDSTAEQVMTLLTSLTTGEGQVAKIGRESFDLRDRQMGILAALTNNVFREVKGILEAGGLLSRFFVLRLNFSAEEKARIRDNVYFQRDKDKTTYEWVLEKPAVVSYDGGLGKDIKRWLERDLEMQPSPRKIQMANVMLKSIALLSRPDARWKKHGVVVSSDLDKLKLFGDYIKLLEG